MPYIKRTWREYKKNKYLFLLLAPVLIWYIIFEYGPLYGVQLAFKDFYILRGINDSPWVGLKHFVRMFSGDTDFKRILINTVLISTYKLIWGFPAPIILALLFNEVRNQVFKRVTQSISYLPHFFSWVMMAGFVIALLSPSSGVVNHILGWFGIPPIFFLTDPNWFRTTMVVTEIWKGVGWGTIIYLAALAGINPDLYEAAMMDGASRWKQTIHITIPSIANVIAILFIFSMSGILNAGFDQILNLYNPLVYSVGDIIDTYVYRVGLGQMQYSFSTAVGIFKNIIALFLILSVNWIIKRMGQEGLF